MTLRVAHIFLIFVLISQLNCRKIDDKSSSSSSEEDEIVDRYTKFQFSSIESDDEDGITSRFTEGSEESDNDENVDILQGDILMTKKQKDRWMKNLDEEDEESESESREYDSIRKGVLDEEYRWPKDEDGLVMVPYEISKKARFSKETFKIIKIIIFNSPFTLSENKHKKEIRSAIRIIEKHTCIRFPEHDDEVNYIYFYSGAGCDSHIGMIGGRQRISLNKTSSCMERGSILHELLHAIGFDHMQNHPERDKYVKIHWNNILKEDRVQFYKLKNKHFTDFNTNYDYYSVLHYFNNAFAIDEDKPTISAKNSKFDDIIGQRNSISRGDIRRINRMYECENVKWT